MLSLAEADPKLAAAPLALARALDAAYQDKAGKANEPALLKELAKAYHSLGLHDRAVRAAGGDR